MAKKKTSRAPKAENDNVQKEEVVETPEAEDVKASTPEASSAPEEATPPVEAAEDKPVEAIKVSEDTQDSSEQDESQADAPVEDKEVSSQTASVEDVIVDNRNPFIRALDNAMTDFLTLFDGSRGIVSEKDGAAATYNLYFNMLSALGKPDLADETVKYLRKKYQEEKVLGSSNANRYLFQEWRWGSEAVDNWILLTTILNSYSNSENASDHIVIDSAGTLPDTVREHLITYLAN